MLSNTSKLLKNLKINNSLLKSVAGSTGLSKQSLNFSTGTSVNTTGDSIHVDQTNNLFNNQQQINTNNFQPNFLNNYLLTPPVINNDKVITSNSYQKFDMDKCAYAHSNEEISDRTIIPNIPDAMMRIAHQEETVQNITYRIDNSINNPKVSSKNRYSDVAISTYCKPVACYLFYLDTKQVQAAASLKTDHKKGSETLKTTTHETTLSIGASVKGMDASYKVSTGYKYTDQFDETTEVGFTNYLGKGTYNNYQTVMLYQYRIPVIRGTPTQAETNNFIKSLQSGGLNTKFYAKSNGDVYYYVDMFRLDPFTKVYSTDLYQSFGKDEVSDYIFKNLP